MTESPLPFSAPLPDPEFDAWDDLLAYDLDAYAATNRMDAA